MQNKIKQKYNEKLENYSSELIQLKRKNKIAGYSRGIIFIAGISLAIILKDFGLQIIIITVVSFLIPFLFLIKLNSKYKKRIAYLREIISINKNELLALDRKYSQFPNGKEYINYDHQFTYDMDVFGEASLFQYINRTCTNIGKNFLARWFQNPAESSGSSSAATLVPVPILA